MNKVVETPIEWGRACSEASEALREGLKHIQTADDPANFLVAVRNALTAFGVDAQRLNLPASRVFGFRHPLYGIALMTSYVDRPTIVNLMDHQKYNQRLASLEDVLIDSPYYGIVVKNDPWYRAEQADGQAHPPVVHEIFDEGYPHYIAIGLKLANGMTQPLGIASKTPFPKDFEERLHVLIPLLSSGIEAFYARYAAFHMAKAYLGRNTGPRALDGTFSRGATEIMRAGVLFCDIRGFTALSEELGASKTVPIINRIFESVGLEIESQEGEILKFIGDALLAIFPAPKNCCRVSLADRMVNVVVQSITAVDHISQDLNRPLAVGFGGHVGEVLYGNIGTPERLDFTVMGPAVNLASRLESLCKSFNVSAVFSDEIGQRHEGVKMLGETTVKGVEQPVSVYGLNN